MLQVTAGNPPSSSGQVSTVKHLDPLLRRDRDFFLGLFASKSPKRGPPGVTGVEGVEAWSSVSIFCKMAELSLAWLKFVSTCTCNGFLNAEFYDSQCIYVALIAVSLT